MSIDKDSAYLVSTVIFVIVLFIAGFPLKNWLAIKRDKKKELSWERWLNEKPSRTKYCETHRQNPDKICCDYCGAGRQLPSLEMVITHEPKFGFFNNTFDKYSHFKTYICSRCGTELYRERYEE